MKISIIGCGYVGAVTGICFAERGQEVTFVDVDRKKLEALGSGRAPIYEPGLENLLQICQSRITTTMAITEAVSATDLTFICVGTPSKSDGSIDLRYVLSVAGEIGEALGEKDQFHTVVVKSTVFPGTTADLVKPLLEERSGKKAFTNFGIGSNPEFLKEGCAVRDFLSPDRIVIGADDGQTRKVMEDLYAPFTCPKVVVPIKTAEMIKYTSNAFLATKITFANEIGNLCKSLGIDSYEVFKGVGMDARIGPAFFRSGIGFGGSCFPKDLSALIAGAESHGVDTAVLKAVVSQNRVQPLKLVELLRKHLPDLRGRRIGLLGLAFKPETDDIRESRAIPVVGELMRQGVRVVAYDPMAMENFRKVCPAIEYASSADEVLATDAVLILTEWPEFNDLDYHGRTVIDGRRVERARAEATVYEGVCW
jgi:UDPglucose 6-dehydrogenase